MTDSEIVETFIIAGLYRTFATVTKGLRVQLDFADPGLEDVARRIVTENFSVRKP